MITGDYTRHNTKYLTDQANATVLDAIQTVSELVALYWPTTAASVLHLPTDVGSGSGIVLGNNDFTPNYGVPSEAWTVDVQRASSNGTVWSSTVCCHLLRVSCVLLVLFTIQWVSPLTSSQPFCTLTAYEVLVTAQLQVYGALWLRPFSPCTACCCRCYHDP